MSFSVATIALVLLALAILCKQFLRLRSIPGPLLAKFSDVWYLFRVSQGDFEHQNLKLHAKYGPVVRYGPNRVSLSSPNAISAIYGHGTQFSKSAWYSTWTIPDPGHPTAGQESWSIFADQSIPRHSHNRRLYQNAYSLTSLLSYEPYVDDCADLFCQRLSELAWAGYIVDMRHWFQCYAFDVIGMITYAKRFGFLDKGEDVGGIIEALEGHLFYATLVGIIPSWHPFLYKVRNHLAGNKGYGRAYIIKFTLDCINQDKTIGKSIPVEEVDDENTEYKAESFLTKFLTKHAEDPTRFTRQHIIDGCTSNMVAGSDTTAISLSAILFYLLSNPSCHRKLLDEITSFEQQGLLSRSPTFKETQKMPYFQAVIKEALRLHPATGLPLERVVSQGGVTMDGRFLPEGTVVGINTWVEHRNREIYGDDADSFNPDRWLNSDEETLSKMNRHHVPFGLGSRTCIGRHISMLEMTKLIPRIVRDFDFELHGQGADGTQKWPTQNYWFVKPTDFRVKILSKQK